MTDAPSGAKRIGRPPGAPGIKSKKDYEHIRDGGVLPIEVMVQTMRECWNKSQQPGGDPAERMHQKMLAVNIAEKAAPYLHPRLSSANVSVRKVRDVADLSDEEIAALIASAGVDEAARSSKKPNQVH